MREEEALPESWRRVSLGDVVPYGATRKAEPEEIEDSAWLLELEDIEKDTSRLLSRVTFGQRKSKSTKNRFSKGDVLYGKLRPYLNKVLFADQDGYCTTEVVPIEPNEAVEGRYLFYWLRHPVFLDYVTAVSHGLNMPRLGTDAGRSAPFVLAPISEQRRIAARLDAVLAKVDACRARLDRVPQILKRFREAVLEAAVSGRLTEEWRDGRTFAQTAEDQVRNRERSRSGRLRVRSSGAAIANLDIPDVPSSWAWIQNHRLAEDSESAICAGPFGTIFKAKDFRSSGVPIIFLRHVSPNRYVTGKPGYMDEQVWRELHQPYSILGGELLVTKLGDPPGTACIYPNGLGVAMVTPDVMKMSVDGPIAMTKYLMYFFNSPLAKRLVEQLAFGVTRLRIDLAMFKAFPIPLPTIEEQSEVVRRVDELFSLADSIERQYRAAVARVERLTPAVLAKAFRGELVPQDPNDEPAEKLLERIRAAREAEALEKGGQPGRVKRSAAKKSDGRRKAARR